METRQFRKHGQTHSFSLSPVCEMGDHRHCGRENSIWVCSCDCHKSKSSKLEAILRGET